MNQTIERRSLPIEIRADAENRKIIGHAAIFESISYSGRYFAEQIARNAFAESIKVDDVRALFNHDANYVLGRNKAGTLTLREDEKGLAIEIDPPDTQFARDLLISIGRGDISQMSFGFEVVKESWEERKGDVPLRTLENVKLWDISPVTFPFYTDTDVALKSLAEYRSQLQGEPPCHIYKPRLLRALSNNIKRRIY